MEEKEIEVNGEKIRVALEVPRGYIEDNNLKILLDDTIDLNEVIKEINDNE